MRKICKGRFHSQPVELELTEFPKDKSRKDGHYSECKECVRKRKAEWLQKVYAGDSSVQSLDDLRKAHVDQCYKQLQRKSPKQRLFFLAKGRSTQKNQEFDITEDDIIIPEFCPILGIKLKPEQYGTWHKKQKKPWNSPSLDRIDSSKGYVRGNIQVISWRANHLKSDATPEELKALGEYAAKLVGVTDN